MSLDLEARMRIFHASAPQNIWPIQTLQISHSAMSQSFNLWREPYAGTTYDAGVPLTMAPCNIEIKLAGLSAHLDQLFDIRLDLVDAEDVFREQLDRIPIKTKEFVRIVYRQYLSDDLTAPSASAVLQAEGVSWDKGAARIIAVSPRLNITRTGEVYSLKAVPMLRGFL